MLGNNDLADAFRELLDNLHENIEAMDDGQPKVRAQRLAKVAHGALEALRDHAADHGLVEPFSGGDPKP